MDELAWGQIWAGVKKKVQAEHPDLVYASRFFWQKQAMYSQTQSEKPIVYDSVFMPFTGDAFQRRVCKRLLLVYERAYRSSNMIASGGKGY
jgi:hypothetical protein